MDKRFEHFNREKLQMPSEHVKKCLISLVIREKQSKSTVKYYYLPIGMAKIKTKQIEWIVSNAGKVMEQLETSHFWWEGPLVELLWKTLS